MCLYLLLLLPPCCLLPLCPCLLTVSALALSTTPMPSSLHISSPSPSPLLFSHIFRSAHIFLLVSTLLLLSHYIPFSTHSTAFRLTPPPFYFIIYFYFIIIIIHFCIFVLLFVYFPFYYYSKAIVIMCKRLGKLHFLCCVD